MVLQGLRRCCSPQLHLLNTQHRRHDSSGLSRGVISPLHMFRRAVLWKSACDSSAGGNQEGQLGVGTREVVAQPALLPVKFGGISFMQTVDP